MFGNIITRYLRFTFLALNSLIVAGCSTTNGGDNASASTAEGTMVADHLAADRQNFATGAGQQLATVHYRTVKTEGLDIFYREAGPPDAPAVLLLHGFPTSSQMFRDLIPILAAKFHVIAPDYPGYGHSSMPPHDKFSYTFDNLAKVIDSFTEQLGLGKYAIYVQDYGAPVGYRLAVKHPERISAIVVQNGNAYDEGLDNDFWKPIKDYWKEPNSKEKRDAIRSLLTYEATKWQYTEGFKHPEMVSPDGPAHDQFLLDRKGNDEIQLDLFLSYGSNPPLYPSWQQYFRKFQPPMLIVWGKNDKIFPPAGAEPYKRDIKELEFHLLDTGHFALEDSSAEIGHLMLNFLDRQANKASQHIQNLSTSKSPTAREIRGSAPVVPLATEPPPKIVIDPPLPDQLAKGRVVIQYRTENLHIVSVFGPNALNVSPRIGHIHVTVDDASWHWADASGEPLIMNGFSAGPHKILIELVDANHKPLDQGVVTFEIPGESAPSISRH